YTPTENKDVNMKFPFTNPRIYFLAPNYRRPALQNEKLRQMLSQGIDRQQILENVFRGKGRKQHVALNGPYPVGSWAYAPEATNKSAYNAQEANRSMQEARGQLQRLPNLTLVYPDEDAEAKAACTAIASQMSTLGVTLTVSGMPTAQLAEEFAKDQPNFDL